MFNQQQLDPSMQLTGLRTREGTYWENYQLCTPDADWVSPGHRTALKLLREFLLLKLGLVDFLGDSHLAARTVYDVLLTI